MEKVAKNIGDGDLSHYIQLRPKDELKELADAFNVMTQGLAGRLYVLKDLLDEAQMSGASDALIEDLRSAMANFKLPSRASVNEEDLDALSSGEMAIPLEIEDPEPEDVTGPARYAATRSIRGDVPDRQSGVSSGLKVGNSVVDSVEKAAGVSTSEEDSGSRSDGGGTSSDTRRDRGTESPSRGRSRRPPRRRSSRPGRSEAGRSAPDQSPAPGRGLSSREGVENDDAGRAEPTSAPRRSNQGPGSSDAPRAGTESSRRDRSRSRPRRPAGEGRGRPQIDRDHDEASSTSGRRGPPGRDRSPDSENASSRSPVSPRNSQESSGRERSQDAGRNKMDARGPVGPDHTHDEDDPVIEARGRAATKARVRTTDLHRDLSEETSGAPSPRRGGPAIQADESEDSVTNGGSRSVGSRESASEDEGVRSTQPPGRRSRRSSAGRSSTGRSLGRSTGRSSGRFTGRSTGRSAGRSSSPSSSLSSNRDSSPRESSTLDSSTQDSTGNRSRPVSDGGGRTAPAEGVNPARRPSEE